MKHPVTQLAYPLLLTCFAGGAFAQTKSADPAFAPITMPPHIYAGEWEYFVGGGVAVFDCNGDSLPEIFAAGGAASAQMMRNVSTPSEIKFETDTPPALALNGVTGAYPIDLDSDGILDLVVLRLGENRIFKGHGDCSFTPMGSPFDVAQRDAWTTAFSATWEEDAKWPTLAFGNYIDRYDPDGPFETCDTSWLWRPEDGVYSVSALDPGFCTLSMLFSDWGRLGRADLRVSNDRHYYVRGGSEQMWAMEQTPRLYSQDDGWKDYALWGMGIASRDITGDGLPEVYLTSMGDQKLHTLEGQGTPTYANAPFGQGITAHRPYTGGDGRPSTGWHVAFGDVQNDGLDDIFVTKGNVEQMPVAAMLDPNNLMIAQGDGTFAERGDVAGIASLERGRGGALVDLNQDGKLDIVVNNRRAPLEVFQNITQGTGNWLGVSITQDGTNPLAVGALVEVRADGHIWTQELTVGGGHAGGQFVPLHFGLGALNNGAEVTVIWPDQSRTVHDIPDLNQVVFLKQ